MRGLSRHINLPLLLAFLLLIGNRGRCATGPAAVVASVYSAVTVGNPNPPGTQRVVSNGVNISGGGDIGGTGDDFQFSYLQTTGDFDFKVRLASVTLASSWSEAGMVARENLAPGARSAGALATPSISGCFFQSRITSNGTATTSGSFPVNYPNTWLRLQRTGDSFSGYAGFDGQNWTPLGSAFALDAAGETTFSKTVQAPAFSTRFVSRGRRMASRPGEFPTARINFIGSFPERRAFQMLRSGSATS